MMACEAEERLHALLGPLIVIARFAPSVYGRPVHSCCCCCSGQSFAASESRAARDIDVDIDMTSGCCMDLGDGGTMSCRRGCTLGSLRGGRLCPIPTNCKLNGSR